MIDGVGRGFSISGKLSPLQETILNAFLDLEGRFFLTRGAALAGFYLNHRETADLDLFATSDVLNDGDAALRAAATAIEASVENVQTSPDIRRRLVKRRQESVLDSPPFECDRGNARPYPFICMNTSEGVVAVRRQ